MDYKYKARLTNWNPEKGFGFVNLEGKRAFVHVTDISPYHERGADLSGQMLVVYSTTEDQKGLRVTSAATLEEHERQLSAKAEEQRQEEMVRLEEIKLLADAKTLLSTKAEELWQKISQNPLDGDRVFILNSDSRLSLKARKNQETATVVSCDSELVVDVNISLTARVNDNQSSTYGRACLRGEVGSETREFTVRKSGYFWARKVREDDPLKETAMAFKAEAVRQLAEAEHARQVAGILKGCELAGIAGLVDPEEVLKSWPTAGDHFPQFGYHGEFEALRWLRQNREKKITAIHDASAEKLGVKATESWYEEATWDPNYDNEAHGGDGMKGPGNYVGGGLKTKRFGWSQEMIRRLCEVDQAQGFTLDVQPLAEAEMLQYLNSCDAKEMASAWAREERIILPENKLKFARIQLARWIRSVRREGAREWRGWKQPPTTLVGEVAEKSETVLAKLKEYQLRKEGLKAEEARKAAENAEEERKLLSLADVRKNWREMTSWRSRSLRNLHPEAQALLEKIRTAQSQAENLKRQRGYSAEAEERLHSQEAERIATEEKREQDARFLTGNAWSALDQLKLKK